ncbi:MAG: phosphatase, partial [Verrucomicrobia bacterium]|nr:phosphatase [Cytophagales bacterium]
EPDAMGTNLLRLGFWLKNGQQQPYIGILTALNNESAQQLAEREHFNTVFADFKNKKRALDYICQKYNLQPEEIVFFFDDVLDLSVAESIGVSIMIRRDASPLFVEYVRERNLCHYITGNTGSTHAVREACELILGMTNMYDQTVSKRMSYDEEYQQYWKERNSQNTAFFTPSTIE